MHARHGCGGACGYVFDARVSRVDAAGQAGPWHTTAMPRFLPVTALSVAKLATSTLLAQAVLPVPASYPQIGAAIAAAQPGDVIEIASGTYAPFTCNKAITI